MIQKPELNRELNLDKSVYYSDGYFNLRQLCSFAHQIHDIYHLKPINILEIGIGNGFTSSFLRRAGFEVVTVDINPNLDPDICCPISEIESFLEGRFFDLIVCCEVLEHLPFEEFEASIKIFRMLGKRLYLTLPNYNRVFGASIFFDLPLYRFPRFVINAHFDVHRKKLLDPERGHFWEVGSSKLTTKKKLNKRLKSFYNSVRIREYTLNPYHISFLCV